MSKGDSFSFGFKGTKTRFVSSRITSDGDNIHESEYTKTCSQLIIQQKKEQRDDAHPSLENVSSPAGCRQKKATKSSENTRNIGQTAKTTSDKTRQSTKVKSQTLLEDRSPRHKLKTIFIGSPDRAKSCVTEAKTPRKTPGQSAWTNIMKLAKSPSKVKGRRSNCFLATTADKKPKQLRKSNKFKLYKQPGAPVRCKPALTDASFTEIPCAGKLSVKSEKVMTDSQQDRGPIEHLPGTSDR